MDNQLSAKVHDSLADWHALRKLDDEFKRLADEYPAEAAQQLLFVAGEWYLRSRRDLYSDFGMRVGLTDPYLRVVEPEFAPRDADDLLAAIRNPGGIPAFRKGRRLRSGSAFSKECFIAIRNALLYKALHVATMQAKEDEDPVRAVLATFHGFLAVVSAGWFGSVSEESWEYPELRDLALAMLTGWVVSRTSLHANKRLKRVLSSGTHVEAFRELLRQAPDATFSEWVDGGGLAGLVSLRTRVAGNIEKLGREAEIKSNTVELGGGLEEAHPYLGQDDDGLTDFEARETAQQELRKLVDFASLSESEARVMELELGGLDADEIARSMGNKATTVRVFKSRYRAKIRKAAGDDYPRQKIS